MYGFAEYEEYYNYIKGKRFYVPANTISDIGKDTWYSLLHEFVGSFTTDRRQGSSIDMNYEEMHDLFPWIFSLDIYNPTDQLLLAFDTYRKAREERKRIRSETERNH